MGDASMKNVTARGADRGAKARQRARRRSIGAVMVEYALLLTFVAIPTVVGFTAAGVTLLSAYINMRDYLLLPTP
ncbi:MAG: hypothetical protein ACRELY_01260 [Polyangiaceae bacterium]